jgi:hypothetical protein
MALVAAVCAVGGTYQWLGPIVFVAVGIGLFVWAVGAALCYRKYWELAVIAILLPVGVFMLLPSVSTPRVATRRAACNNNLRQILIGLHNYHDVYGSLPPAYVADENGRPMHSWRVLILPFIEQKSLYDQYRFDEPWDGPNNRLLGQLGLPIFRCPSDSQAVNGQTSYVLVVGNGTAWPRAKSAQLGDIKDGTSHTILVVEVQHSGIHWMEPRDLDLAQLPLSVNPPRGLGISSEHKHGAHVGLGDGSVRFVPNDLPGKTLQELLTIDGGETVDWP